jgi:hypothetical protein
MATSIISDFKLPFILKENGIFFLAETRGETIHLPHDMIRIAIFHYDTVIFDMIHLRKIKLKRKYFLQKKKSF